MPGDQHRLNLLEGKFHWLSLIRQPLSLNSTVTVFDVKIIFVKEIVAMESQERITRPIWAGLDGSWTLSSGGYGVVFLLQRLCNLAVLPKLICLHPRVYQLVNDNTIHKPRSYVALMKNDSIHP